MCVCGLFVIPFVCFLVRILESNLPCLIVYGIYFFVTGHSLSLIVMVLSFVVFFVFEKVKGPFTDLEKRMCT